MTRSGWNTLVQPEALAAALDERDVVVVDCRFSLADPEAGEQAYRAGHIPGARYAHLDRDLSDHGKQGQGRHPWPDASDFSARLSDWGISPGSRVLAYDAGDGAFAARLWCLLKMLGHEAVAVLDGGWARWTALGLPVDAAVPSPSPAAYAATFDASRLFDADGVRRHLDAGGLVLDARAPERFRGEVEPIDPVPGHVPGAGNRPYASNLVDGRFKPAAQLRTEFDALLDGRRADAVVAMCGSGVTACHHLLAMAHAGLPGAKLFTGSWSGWIADPSRPVATGD
ncbi:sulfurtransferase [Luteimonas marina]|uniref:Sulfurtransferase n=1 Tax=Luteimonas marina TaxID=488485 RepID=A0A5C5TW10_9GAMM|nr:sulfurtransferase [Luteimonas marina]TWT17482.1 sulfurtransferase [Luteimonas marina]